MHFGESGTLTDSVAAEAEKYLVKTIQPKLKCSTFNQLRYDYQINRKTPLPDLPPTSYSIQMHLLRCSFVVHQGISLIRNPVDQDPTEFGWFKEDGYYKPIKYLLEVPGYLYVRCGCNAKCTGRCTCNRNDTVCTEYCNCKGACTNN